MAALTDLKEAHVLALGTRLNSNAQNPFVALEDLLHLAIIPMHETAT